MPWSCDIDCLCNLARQPQLWLHPEVNGIGAGIDSFYEYALKWYIMSGKQTF